MPNGTLRNLPSDLTRCASQSHSSGPRRPALGRSGPYADAARLCSCDGHLFVADCAAFFWCERLLEQQAVVGWRRRRVDVQSTGNHGTVRTVAVAAPRGARTVSIRARGQAPLVAVRSGAGSQRRFRRAGLPSVIFGLPGSATSACCGGPWDRPASAPGPWPQGPSGSVTPCPSSAPDRRSGPRGSWKSDWRGQDSAKPPIARGAAPRRVHRCSADARFVRRVRRCAQGRCQSSRVIVATRNQSCNAAAQGLILRPVSTRY